MASSRKGVYKLMKSSTERPARKTDNRRSGRPAKTKGYTKQTAQVEARRDGKPLFSVFGLKVGVDLSHREKVKFQRRATWTTTILIGLIILAVIVGFWLNINVIIPGQPITSVNGHQIPQSQYRKLAAFMTELDINNINGVHGLIAQRKSLEQQIADQQKVIDTQTKQIDDLDKQVRALSSDPKNNAKRTDLNNQLTAAKKQLADAQKKRNDLNNQLTTLLQSTIPLAQQRFTQSQVGNDSATWLQDDELIREWLATQSGALQAKINPSASDVERALNQFKADFPKTGSYNAFLNQDSVSDDDMHAMMALKLRRDNMQNYLASQIVSPTYQVLARSMTIDTLPHAQQILKQLQDCENPQKPFEPPDEITHRPAPPPECNFGKIAKAQSVDASTKDKGGDLGWQARGQYAQQEQQAIVENWLFDPARHLNEISPILKENGTYHIVQIMGIDPARAVDKDTLKTLKDYALSDWLLIQRALPDTKITPVDQNKLTDPMNLPPDLPAGAPGGAPGAPSGLPSGGQP